METRGKIGVPRSFVDIVKKLLLHKTPNSLPCVCVFCTRVCSACPARAHTQLCQDGQFLHADRVREGRRGDPSVRGRARQGLCDLWQCLRFPFRVQLIFAHLVFARFILSARLQAGFRKGMDLYFKRHDGCAVTCDDFLAAMADANGEGASTRRAEDVIEREDFSIGPLFGRLLWGAGSAVQSELLKVPKRFFSPLLSSGLQLKILLLNSFI